MTERRTRRGALTGVASGGASATALTLLLAACAAPGGEPGAQTKGPVKLGVVTRGGGDGTGMEQVIIPAFTKMYPNIQVEHASLGGEPDYWAKVVTGHLGKDLADVVWASTGGFNALGVRGVFKELDSLARADKYDFKDYVPGGPGHPQGGRQAAGAPLGRAPRLPRPPLQRGAAHPRRVQGPGRHVDVGPADRGGQSLAAGSPATPRRTSTASTP